MSIKIKLTANERTGAGVNFNKAYDAFFTDFVPASGGPQFLGATEDETTQVAHIAEPVEGREAQTRAVLLNGEDFFYTFSNHTVSGTIDSIDLVRLGDAWDDDAEDLALEDGTIQAATSSITFSGLGFTNPAGETGDVHDIVAGLMGGGPSGSEADPTAMTELLFGEAQVVTGSTGDDTYAGTRFGDTVHGLGGADRLSGRGGADDLDGGRGTDILTGGAGRDTFIFGSVSEAKGDRITDFDRSERDQIDLSGIDADEGTRRDQAFDFIGDDGFDREAGELRVVSSDSRTVVMGDTDGDGQADFRIVLNGDVDLNSGSFLL